MASQLDCRFYTSFYEDLSSLGSSNAIVINEHYLTVGKEQGRVADRVELHNLLATILHFDENVYSSANLSGELSSTLKDAVKDVDWLCHYYDAINGALFSVPRFSAINNNDLIEFSNKWESIYLSVFNEIYFNLSFYRSFYNIPEHINNTRDLQLHWLKTGMFVGQKPNLKSMDENRNVIVAVQTILLKKFNLDMSLLATYKDIMSECAKINGIEIPEAIVSDENALLLFLLLNTGQQLRLFFNKNEQDNYVAARKEEYTNAVTAVKKMVHSQAMVASNKAYNNKTISLLKFRKMDSIPILKQPFNNVISVFNIVKLSNEIFINGFKKVYGTEDLSVIIPLIASHEMNNSLNPTLNSMEIKILVTSLVYNTFLVNKVDSKLYATFVKETSISIISKMFAEESIADFESSLEQDINFIIDNKKIVKLCYLGNLAIKLAVEAFVLGL
jgi:hypothetical protein